MSRAFEMLKHCCNRVTTAGADMTAARRGLGQLREWLWCNAHDAMSSLGRSTVAPGLTLCLFLAPTSAHALDWQDLWLNDDQRAAEKMAREDYAAAAETFRDDRWRAAALYRAGDYEQAAETWSTLDGVEAHYNRGNALARAGRLHQAAAAYESVLEMDPGHADARHNLEVIRQMMQESENQSPQEQDSQRRQDSRQRDNERNESRQQDQPRTRDEQQRRSPGQQGGRDRQAPQDEQSRQDDRRQEQAERNPAEPREQPARPQTGDEPTRAQPPGERAEEADEPEQRAATEQWLRRIPDDPGGLLRRKFRYQYGQRGRGEEPVAEPW